MLAYAFCIFNESSIHCINYQRDDEVSGSIAIFPQPNQSAHEHTQNNVIKICRIPFTTISGIYAHTLRNLLWSTSMLPVITECSRESRSEHPLFCDTLREVQNGYIFLNDEDDGFRIFWLDFSMPLQTQSEHNDWIVLDSSTPMQMIRPKRHDIVSIISDRSTETEWVHMHSGCAVKDSHSNEIGEIDSQHVDVVLESYLKISALLSDILERRRNLICSDFGIYHSPTLPDYFYNLISLEENRSVNLVVVFNNPEFGRMKIEKKKVPASYGVIVKLDLFDHSYTELKWLQHPSRNDTDFLRRWSNNLAKTIRMTEVHVGPYCIPASTGTCNVCVQTHELNIDDQDHDMDIELWKPFLDQLHKKRENNMQPKLVAMSSLYPECDIINNHAVTSGVPVRSISCRDYPLELSYN